MSSPQVLSFGVATTLATARIVTHTTATADAVRVPATSLEPCVGITRDSVLDTSSSIPVQVDGIAELFFNQTVASGAFVESDSAGRGVAFTALTAGSFVIGTLVDAETGTGTVARVLIQPKQISIP